MSVTEWEPEGYDDSSFDPLDISVPGYVTIDPITGQIGAAFTGKVTAIGLTLPVANLTAPTDTNRVRWVDSIAANQIATSPMRGYIDSLAAIGLPGITNYTTQIVAVDQNGVDASAVQAYVAGSSHFPPTDTGLIRLVCYGTIRTLMGAGGGGVLTTGPIVETVPFQGNEHGNPATAVGSGNDYGTILLSQFPPTGGGTPQDGDRVVVIPDGTSYAWSFKYSSVLGGWYCTGGTPMIFASSSPTTLSPASTWLAMGFAYAVPRGGNWIVAGTLSGAGSTAGASTQQITTGRNGSPVSGFNPQFSTPSPSYGWSISITGIPISMVAGWTLDLMAWTNGTNATVTMKNMSVIPQYLT